MKKKFIWLFVLVLSLVTGLLVACSNNDVPIDESTTQIQLDKTELTLDVLAREQLSAIIKDEDGNAISGEISWSSDNTSVASVQNGLVTALSAGTAQITAASGDASAVCNVTVEANGVRPQLLLNAVDFELKTGETSKILSSVRFKTSTLNDADYNITYEFTASEGGVVSVAADGTLTALKYGSATVTVKAIWAQATAAGLDQSLTQTVNVNVLPNYSLTTAIAEGYTSDIYLQATTDGNNTYNDYTVIDVTEALYKGAEITSGIVFRTSDETVATVDATGKVTVSSTANENDTVEVWVEYETENEGVLSSERIQLTVKKAVVQKTLENELIAEVTTEAVLPIGDLFGSATANIVRIYDSEDSYKTNIYNNVSNTYEDVTLLGYRTWVIEGDKIGYEIDVLAVTKIIKTADDFAMFNTAEASSKNCFPGYYILGNNIDASSWEHVNKGYPTAADGIGLTGTFDGRGYTVNGLCLGSGGLFGVVSSTGAVINVAFTNVRINAGTNGLGLMFGWYFPGKMENVYVGIKEFVTEGTSTSASLGLFGLCNDATSFKNIVVVSSATATYTQAVVDRQQYGTLVATSNKGAWQHTFVISDMRLFGGTSTYGDTGNKYVKSVQRFESMTELLSDSYYTTHIVAYDTDIWNTDTLTFISSEEYFNSEFNLLPETLEGAVDTTITVTENANAFKIALSDSAVSNGLILVNGKISITEFTSAEDLSVTVSFGSNVKTIPINVHNSITVEDYAYVYNLATSENFVITGNFPADATEATVSLTGTDGNVITLQATVNGTTLTVTKEQFTGKIPSGVVAMTVNVGGAVIGVNGVKLVYAVNTADEYMAMAEHLVMTSASTYDGSILIAADIDFTGKGFANATSYSLYRMKFNGELDGGYHVLSNITMAGSQSGAVCGTLNGTIKNLIIKNATISTYGGIICYENYGTIESCYVKGTIADDGLSSTSNPDNFGTGLLAGKNRNGSHVKNCIAELISKDDELYAAGAFGKLGDGAASELNIFVNCYAVAASGFALMTYSTARMLKDFNDANGNKNFADIFALFADQTAGALAATMGLTLPVIDSVALSQTQLALSVNGVEKLTATAKTSDGEIVPVDFVWSSSNTAIATVSNGTVTAVANGEAIITVEYGNFSATCTVTVSAPSLENLVLTDFTYECNGTQDFIVTGNFPEAKTVAATVKGTDGNLITLTGTDANPITLSGNSLTIPAALFNVSTMPTKTVEMSLLFDGNEMVVEGAYFIFVINTLSELQSMKTHLTSDYDGHLKLGADIDFTGVAMNTWAMKGVAFKGIFDGDLHTISNLTFATNATACGLLGNMQSGSVAKNLKIINVEINTYCGSISYQAQGTIENCYVQGKIVKDGLSSASTASNFGCGLLVGRLYSATRINNCIVEVTEHGEIYDGSSTTATIYGASAFGMLSSGVSQTIFTNCYAVNADGFTVYTGKTASMTVSIYYNFDSAKTNSKNFATMSDLFADVTACALATSLDLTLPQSKED